LYLAGRDKGGYYHELFLRSKRFLSHRIHRVKIKGEGARKPSSPETEPNFYNAPYLPSARVPSKNPCYTSVGNMVHLGPNMNAGDGGEGSLQRLLAFRGLPASLQQQQVQLPPPPLLNNTTNLFMLEAHQAQVNLGQFRMPPMHPDMHVRTSFGHHNIPNSHGHWP
jgi:hypothetical protein